MLTLSDIEWDHLASIEICAGADHAFNFMKDARNLSEWALGALHPVEATEDSYIGHSMIDGKCVFVKLESNPRTKIIEFRTGRGWDELEDLIQCRIFAVDGADIKDGICSLHLSARRSPSLSPLRWKQLCASHEVEVFIIKNRIEAKWNVNLKNLMTAP